MTKDEEKRLFDIIDKKDQALNRARFWKLTAATLLLILMLILIHNKLNWF